LGFAVGLKLGPDFGFGKFMLRCNIDMPRNYG
jgi:hypothetical protein